jgi:uncharacterized protein
MAPNQLLCSRAVLLPLIAFLSLAPRPAAGQRELPRPSGYVNDFANILAPDEEQAITRVIDEVRAKSGGEIVVVTMS